jgi:membrane associated rhomboid family serine protease
MSARKSSDIFSMAPITMALLGFNIAVFLLAGFRSLEAESGSFLYISPEIQMGLGAAWREGLWDGQWLRLVMPIFLHWSLMHILMNGWALWNLGPAAEVHFGRTNFLTIYLASGIGGCCASILFGGHISAGASGAIFGILGAFLAAKAAACWDWRRAYRNSEVRRIAFFIVGLMVVSGLLFQADNWGHIGGAFFGLLFGLMFELWRKFGRLGPAAILLPLIIWIAAIAGAAHPTFLTHWQVHAGLKADQAGNTAQADAHFRRAVKISSHWPKTWRSFPAKRAMLEAVVNASQQARQAEKAGKIEASLRNDGLIQKYEAFFYELFDESMWTYLKTERS